jgi:succinate dehydrogenase / fumarate reductase flavoprotein subunit
MQGLADGYFVAPYTVANYLAGTPLPAVSADSDPFKEASAAAQQRIDQVLAVRGRRTVREFHRAIGAISWNHMGMARTEAGLTAAIGRIRGLRDEFWQDVHVTGEKNNMNPLLDYAGRVADYMEFAELLARDALHREESCGGHFREEYQTTDNEARRDDERFSYVAAWEFTGVGAEPMLHKEPLEFAEVHPSLRSYK